MSTAPVGEGEVGCTPTTSADPAAVATLATRKGRGAGPGGTTAAASTGSRLNRSTGPPSRQSSGAR